MQSAAPIDLPSHHDPFSPAHVLRRRDLLDLFDTTPDLSGYDLDISRFVRGGDERDVSVAWRKLGASAPQRTTLRPVRDELCPVSIGDLRDVSERQRRLWETSTGVGMECARWGMAEAERRGVTSWAGVTARCYAQEAMTRSEAGMKAAGRR